MIGRRDLHSSNSSRNSQAVNTDIASGKVITLVITVVFLLMLVPSLLHAQNEALRIQDENGGFGLAGESDESTDMSGAEEEDSVQPSGMDDEPVIHEPVTDEGFQTSPGQQEDIIRLMTDQPPDLQTPPGEGFDLSGMEEEPAVESEDDGDLFMLPEIEVPDFAELYDLSPAQTERMIFQRRPRATYYDEVVAGAPSPDIRMLGPLPEAREEGVEFTDFAADWIYHQKSVGMTELRGHVMIIYDTTIITCDEATLDEQNEIHRFFGEGRVFVDDADFTLECDELEIHDAEGVKMIYIYGQSTMVVYADEDAEVPGPDSRRRDRLMYALKQQDTTITFTNAEYDYENDIFDAHGGVRFEQTDKYAEGDEFHGEDETEYMHFTGNCEFYQDDGMWLYDHHVIEDEEDPPSRSDRLVRALMAVPTTVTCDEAEGEGAIGWMEMKSYDGDVVYFYQDDKHAECETFTLWYSRESDDEEAVEEGPTDLLDDSADEEVEEEEYIRPPGFGTPRLADEFPADYHPWVVGAEQFPMADQGLIVAARPVADVPDRPPAEGEGTGELTEGELPEGELPEGVGEEYFGPDRLDGGSGEDMDVMDPSESSDGEGLDLGMAPMAGAPSNIPGGQLPEFTPSDPSEVTEPVADISELTEDMLALIQGGRPPEEAGDEGRNEVIMVGNVFVRQENGDWLFDQDVIREEEETEEDIEQYRKWANGSCDYLHVWTSDEIVEATGNVFGEQDNQDVTCTFLKYMATLEMIYMLGPLTVHREDKHQLMSNEAFLFLSTNVFEALGQVQTTVMVDVEERSGEAAPEGQDEESETP